MLIDDWFMTSYMYNLLNTYTMPITLLIQEIELLVYFVIVFQFQIFKSYTQHQRKMNLFPMWDHL